MTSDETNSDVLAIRALGWILSDPGRAQRLLALTGLTPEALREGLSEPTTLAAVLAFLEAHEPDLIACAEAVGAAPVELVEARHKLETR